MMFHFLSFLCFLNRTYSHNDFLKCNSFQHIQHRKKIFVDYVEKKGRFLQYLVDEKNVFLKEIMSLPLFSFDNFEVLNLLGTGSNSFAYLIREKGTEKKYVSKFPRILDHSGYIKEAFLQKIAEHRYVLGIKGFFLYNKTYSPIIEYSQKTLKMLVKEKGVFSEEIARKYICQTIVAIERFHFLGIYHNDLTYDNIFLNSEGDILIADFGDAEGPDLGFKTRHEERRAFYHNENLMTEKDLADYKKKLILKDFLYIGKLTCILLYGEYFLEREIDINKIAESICNGENVKCNILFPMKEQFSKISKEARFFIKKLFSSEVETFFSKQNIKDNAWFSDVNWNSFY